MPRPRQDLAGGEVLHIDLEPARLVLLLVVAIGLGRDPRGPPADDVKPTFSVSGVAAWAISQARRSRSRKSGRIAAQRCTVAPPGISRGAQVARRLSPASTRAQMSCARASENGITGRGVSVAVTLAT